MVVVGVLPVQDDTYEPLNDKDIEITAQCGRQKAGGQNVNKVASAIRAKHIPTGIAVFINGRDQGRNKKDALKILSFKVNEQAKNASNQKYGQLRKSVLGNSGRGDKIRTYNFLERRIVDHRTSVKLHNMDVIFSKGRFDLLNHN